MVFWTRFYNLCIEKKTKPNPLAQQIGVSSGAVTKWKNGTIPPADVLIKIADYFETSIDYLLGRVVEPQTEKDKKIIASIETGDDNKQKLLNNYDKLNDDGQIKLLDYSADLVSGGRYVKNNQLFGDKEA